MNTIEAIRSRRAIKEFDPHYQMAPQEIEQFFALVRMSPTAFNIQNWRFVHVTDPQLRKEIRALSWDQAQVTDASLFIILCADLRSWEREPARYWSHAPEPVQAFLLPAIDAYYRDKPQVMRDEAMRSCGMAAQTLMLTAKALGYDSCPMDGFDFEAVAKCINLPEDHVIAMYVAIGKGTKDAWPRGGQIPLEEAVIQNHF